MPEMDVSENRLNESLQADQQRTFLEILDKREQTCQSYKSGLLILLAVCIVQLMVILFKLVLVRI